MFRLGLDIGSRNTKLVVFDSERGSIVHSAWKETEISVLNSVNTLIAASLRALSISREDFQFCGVTGYGRKLYPGPASVLSEITCHAAGCKFIFPEVRTIIDIGGQDSKIITLDPEGKVLDFAMNDKCAAGTGRFLEMTALRLGLLNHCLEIFVFSNLIGLINCLLLTIILWAYGKGANQG